MPIIDIKVKGADKVIAALERKQEDYKKAVKRTISDMKSRAPGAVASAVTQFYNIKKSEIMPTSTKSGGTQKKAVTLRVTGETIENLALVYNGRLLTPIHFGMTPKAPPAAGKPYKLKFEVKKGQKKEIKGKGNYSQPPFLAPVPKAKTEENPLSGSQFIPFQRRLDSRKLAYSVRTLGVPEMIDNEENVRPIIKEKLDDLLGKRLDYHMSKVK